MISHGYIATVQQKIWFLICNKKDWMRLGFSNIAEYISVIEIVYWIICSHVMRHSKELTLSRPPPCGIDAKSVGLITTLILIKKTPHMVNGIELGPLSKAGGSHSPKCVCKFKCYFCFQVKFAFLTKILQSITGVLASSTQAQSEKNGMLVYPPPKKGLF